MTISNKSNLIFSSDTSLENYKAITYFFTLSEKGHTKAKSLENTEVEKFAYFIHYNVKAYNQRNCCAIVKV